MPVCVVNDLANPGTQVPTHLMRIPIPLLTPTSDCINKTVKGRVVHKGPLVSMDDDFYVLKTVIQEEDSQQSPSSEHTSINVIIFGALAKDYSESVSKEDVLLAAGFTVIKSPTAQKDKLHPCNLQLAGDDAWVYVCPSSTSGPTTSIANKRTCKNMDNAEVTTSAKASKYSYVPLSDLKPGAVVNIYAIVTFFKQPFPTKGTDSCSTLKIIDQSNQKVCCTIFCDKLDDHPKIFKMGDIVRLHRVKAQLYNGSISLLTTHGFSVVTFDGAVSSPVVPRTSSRSFHFDDEDRRAVEALRTWATNQSVLPTQPSHSLSAVQPRNYFDLTCQLLAKAPMDSSCTLLKVWDGTKCSHPLLNVIVEPNTLEGSPTLSKDRDNLTANILVYDNHLEVTRQLKPGAYLRIYNLHAVPGASKLPGNNTDQSDQMEHLAFHLHGGTSYGRGIRVLPDNSPDIQELKRTLESFSDPDVNDITDSTDSALLEVWSTPPELFEQTCEDPVEQVTLAEVKRRGPPRLFHVHTQLKSYQPQRLFQSLKLYCDKCKAMRDLPDDDTVGRLFTEALRGNAGPCSEDWTISGQLDLSGGSPTSPHRTLSLHMPRQLLLAGKAKELIFLKGATLEETCQVALGYSNIVPVRSSEGKLTLLDLSAPFLFRGSKQYYGCEQCSQVKLLMPFVEGLEVLDEKSVAEALGVQLLQYGILMKLELQDGTGSLEALLWRDAESFFQVSAQNTAVSQEEQDRVQQTMDRLCLPGSSMAERPWLDLCLSAYTVEVGGQNRACYQICHTAPPRDTQLLL